MPSRRLRVDFSNDLVTFLLSVVVDLTHLWVLRQVSPKFFGMLSQILPSLGHYSTLGEMSRVLYGLLISVLLARGHVRF